MVMSARETEKQATEGDKFAISDIWNIITKNRAFLAALCSFCCFTFIWCINAGVRAKMAEWKAAKAAK